MDTMTDISKCQQTDIKEWFYKNWQKVKCRHAKVLEEGNLCK